ncbi:MAG: anti-sigma factor family protein [Planctomycetota bacterium]|jgi:anti-sigma factor RsiW
MNCTEIRELLSPYIDGELTAEETLAIKNHLDGCPECARLHAELREGWRLLAAAPVPPISTDFNARFWNRLKTGHGVPAGREITSRRMTFRRIAGYAAAALILIVFGLIYAFRGPGDDATGRLTREEAEIVENLDVLESLEVVQDLDIIENLDILTELDETDFENL